MTRNKGTNVNKINTTLASCICFCFTKRAGRKGLPQKGEKLNVYAARPESRIIIQQTSKGRQLEERYRHGRLRLSQYSSGVNKPILQKRRLHSMIDELHSTGTNTGPKTGVVRVTYKRTPDG